MQLNDQEVREAHHLPHFCKLDNLNELSIYFLVV